jgi:4-hydroxy-2-oxoheptanedioate aldolase
MKSNPVRAKLKAGQPSVGTWLNFPSPVVAQLMARSGFDWLTVELEHTGTSFETAGEMFAIIAASGGVPLVRVPWNTGENIKRVLDIGAWGIVVPMVNSRAEAEAVVKAARYRPIGERSIGGQQHAINFSTNAVTYYAKANDEILVVVMAETPQAVENIDGILSVPGIDAVFVGPNDLHASLGLAPAFDSDDVRFNTALKKILASAKAHGIPAGIHVADAAQAQRRIAEGWQFIAVVSEAGFMLSKAAEVVKTLGLGQGAAAVKY